MNTPNLDYTNIKQSTSKTDYGILMDLMFDDLKRVFEYRDTLENKMIEDAAKNCIPPIKGEITKGKIKWRGMKLVCCELNSWIEQRGVRVSPILTIDNRFI